MDTRHFRIFLLLLFPAAVGIAAAVILQSTSGWNPVYAASTRIDLGTFFLFAGLLVSLILLAAWFVYLWSAQQRESQRLQIQEDLLKNRRRFLRQLDHELKNPLTALRMELAYLTGNGPPDEFEKVYTDMSTQVDRISRVVTDLRRIAQMEEQKIQVAPLGLEEVLQEVMEAAEDHPNYAERQVRLTLLSHPLPLSQVNGDRGLLWLACFNLVDNALKFTPPGAEVEVRAFEVHPWQVLEVADDGPGISEMDLPHIFEELFRGQNAHGLSGSGLGLALVRTIVTLHGGTIAVRSQPGQGTIFTMRLPVAG